MRNVEGMSGMIPVKTDHTCEILKTEVLCENCQNNVATVHLTGWKASRVGSGEEKGDERAEQHFCEECAEKLRQSNSLLNPLLKAAPGAEIIKLQVVSVSDDQIVVRGINRNSDFSQNEWAFLASRFPSRYAEQGLEFEMVVTEAQLKWLQGED